MVSGVGVWLRDAAKSERRNPRQVVGSRQWAAERGGSGIKIKNKKPFEEKMAESQSILSMAAEKEPQKAGRAP